MILHFANDGPRASPITNQGLMDLGIDFETNLNYMSLGVVVKKHCPNIIDLIPVIISGNHTYMPVFDKHQVWHKVIHYDFSDTCELTPPQNQIRKKCLRYFKRSLFKGPQRFPIRHKNIKPVDYCAMNEYYLEDIPKIYDVGCFFSLKNPYLGVRRTNLLKALLEWNPPNSMISKNCGFGSLARNSIKFAPSNNQFIEYLQLLNQCKIVFTAYPALWDGDCRTWEAFASKALVFKDISYIQSPHPPVAGIHYIEFDALQPQSIQLAIEQAKYYLRNEKERAEISKKGYLHVKEYHRAANRVMQIIRPPSVFL